MKYRDKTPATFANARASNPVTYTLTTLGRRSCSWATWGLRLLPPGTPVILQRGSAAGRFFAVAMQREAVRLRRYRATAGLTPRPSLDMVRNSSNAAGIPSSKGLKPRASLDVVRNPG